MPRPRGTGRYAKPTYDQAQRIIRKFGGESRLAAMLGVSRISVYRWGYARPIGTDGLIPSHWIKRINDMARIEGVLITPQDWAIAKIKYDEPPEDAPPPLRVRKSLAQLLE